MLPGINQCTLHLWLCRWCKRQYPAWTHKILILSWNVCLGLYPRFKGTGTSDFLYPTSAPERGKHVEREALTVRLEAGGVSDDRSWYLYKSVHNPHKDTTGPKPAVKAILCIFEECQKKSVAISYFTGNFCSSTPILHRKFPKVKIQIRHLQQLLYTCILVLNVCNL